MLHGVAIEERQTNRPRGEGNRRADERLQGRPPVVYRGSGRRSGGVGVRGPVVGRVKRWQRRAHTAAAVPRSDSCGRRRGVDLHDNPGERAEDREADDDPRQRDDALVQVGAPLPVDGAVVSVEEVVDARRRGPEITRAPAAPSEAPPPARRSSSPRTRSSAVAGDDLHQGVDQGLDAAPPGDEADQEADEDEERHQAEKEPEDATAAADRNAPCAMKPPPAGGRRRRVVSGGGLWVDSRAPGTRKTGQSDHDPRLSAPVNGPP